MVVSTVLILLGVFVGCNSVQWVDVRTRLRTMSASDTREGRTADTNTYRKRGGSESLIVLSPDEAIEGTDESQTVEGSKVTRYFQSYKGIPVYDATFTIETDMTSGHVTGQATGKLADGLELDVPSTEPGISEEEASRIAFNHFGTDRVKSNSISLVIYCPEYGPAVLAYKLTFFGVIQGEPSRKTYFINARTGEVLKHWDALTSYRVTAVGGNEKSGPIKYGDDMPYVQAKERKGTCRYKSKEVVVYDFKFQTDPKAPQPVEFDCKEGVHDEINGAYSPSTDAYFFATKVVQMFQQWIKSPPCDLPLTVNVHYGQNKTSAFFDGEAMNFGDGKPSLSFSLVVADILAHEIAHCFTEHHADFEYLGQSGGIDESFSDLIGEAAKLFVFGTNDWKSGSTAMRTKSYVRYLCDQSDDGHSITHVRDYKKDMDVHYLSGVFNRVSCKLAKSPGWSLQAAVQVFAHANRFYWHPTSDFHDAGCGVMKAAYDLGHPLQSVELALNEVGIKPCAMEDYVRSLPINTVMSNLRANKGEQIVFKILTTEAKKRNVQIFTYGGDGDVDLYVGRTVDVTPEKAERKSDLTGNYEYVQYKLRRKQSLFILLVPKSSSFSGVTVKTRTT